MSAPVIARTNTPPGSPVVNDRYLTADAPTTPWTTADSIAIYRGGGVWTEHQPPENDTVFANDTGLVWIQRSGVYVDYFDAVLKERIQDTVATMLIGGTGITVTYDDGAGEITLSVP